MNYRAIFIGGSVDGQERVLPHCNRSISIRGEPQCVYHHILTFGEPHTLVYSLYDIAETLNRLWHRYAGEDHA